jgi:hypothetical protein
VPNSGAASNEACNDVDDNCDGQIDNGMPGDFREPNNSCSAITTLPTVGSGQTLTEGALSIYAQGDGDFYRIPMNETDGDCSCCDFFCTDEDYKIKITLTVPANAGSYRLCKTGGSCSTSTGDCITVTAGTSATFERNYDGACSPFGNDSFDEFIHIQGLNAPAFECTPYTLKYQFLTGCF